MIEGFIQGNVYPYQQRLKELDAENELLRQQVEILTKERGALAVDLDFLEVEPSDSERATWPDQTCAYVESLEQVLRGAEQRVSAARSEVERLKEALLRARTHGVHSKMYHAFSAGDLAEWIDKGMVGDLPEITSPMVRAALEGRS